MKNLTTGLIAVVMIIMVGLACSKQDTKPAENTTTTKDNSSGDNKNKNSSTTSSTPDLSKSPDSSKSSGGSIEGAYNVSGKNPNGQAYNGELTIKKQDQVYQFSWKSAGSSYDGVAIQGGDLVAAGFTTGSDGKGCGAAVYKIGESTLDGNLASWGYNTTSTQTATLISQTKTSGSFNLQGTDTDGSPYKGTLQIKQNGDIFQLTYGGNIAFKGTGIRAGDYLAVGVGRPNCGFAVYAIKDGKLQGIWGGIGASRVGTEVATLK